MEKHKVVVVGGGFAGLQVATSLRAKGVSVTIIDRRNHHLFQPLLYQVATAVLATSEIAWPIRAVFKKRPEVSTFLGEVMAVDTGARMLQMTEGRSIAYDTLVLATGARHPYFGNDEWEAHAPGLKTLEDATTIRRRILSAFERAEFEDDPEKRQALLTFCIVGGGPTGVELAGIIAQLAHKILASEFRTFDTRSARILLIEAGPRILPMFPEKLSRYASERLMSQGVEVLVRRAVTSCDDRGVMLGYERIESKTVIWAAGVEASPAARWLAAEYDRAGRVKVECDLTVPGHSEIFAIGDTASVIDASGNPVPGIAPAAKQQGIHVARTIAARLDGHQQPGAFRYRHLGNLATIGPNAAVIDFGRVTLKGRIAWWLWGIVHIYFLIGVRSRFAVALSWLWISMLGQHSARLITQKETIKDRT